MGFIDKIKEKLSDPKVQQQAKDAVAKAQQKRAQGGGTPPANRYPGGGVIPGTYGSQYDQDSDGDGIPDNQDNDPYGGEEDYTGTSNPVEQTPYSDSLGDQGDVEYVDEDGNPVSADEVQGGEFETEDTGGGDFPDNSQDMGYGDPVQPDEVQDYEAPTDYGSSDSGSSDSGYSDSGSSDSGSSDSGSSDSGY